MTKALPHQITSTRILPMVLNKRLEKEILKHIGSRYTCKGNDAIHDIHEKISSADFFEKNPKLAYVSKELIGHSLKLMTKKGLIDYDGTWIEMGLLGIEELKPWFVKYPKRFWNFFTNDFAKVLSIIATIISIIAFVQSL